VDFTALNFGEQSVFAALNNKCFTTKVDKYDYEVCFFTNSAQKDGGRSTGLGKFQSIEHHEEHTTISFTGGQSCWKGPQRSMTLIVKCGKENELMTATEPSMCSYEAEFRTPIACRQSKLNRLESIFNNMFSDEKSEL